MNRNALGQFTGGRKAKKAKKSHEPGGGGSSVRRKYCAAAGYATQRGDGKGSTRDRPLNRCKRNSKSAFRKQ